MNLTDKEKSVIIEALKFEANELERFLKCTNATEREWQKVSDLYALATDIELTTIDPNYVR